MSAKEQYRKLCSVEQSIPIFNKDWWMDGVCVDNNWDVLIVENGEQIIAALPFFLTKGKYQLKTIAMPKLTQFNGPWIKYPQNQNYKKKISYEKKIMLNIIEQITKLNVASFNQHFHYSITNWLPFLWSGFNQSTRYTYVIEDLTDIDEVLDNFSRVKKQQLKKAKKVVNIKYNLAPKKFYECLEKTYSINGNQVAYSFDLFNRVYSAVYANNSGISLYAEDENLNIHSTLLLIWDSMSAYTLISSLDPKYRKSNSLALLFEESIKLISKKKLKFDFAGTLVESIESSFREFGSIQKPYFNINKTFSPFLLMNRSLEEFKKANELLIKNMLRNIRLPK